jgi:uncharacterized membrane protein YhiD involved in acid resistance
MNKIIDVYENIKNLYGNVALNTTTIVSVLTVVFILSIYEFIVYRYVSHRYFYNKSFNITIAILPFFISVIILCLQSNIVITLGTIGALAIIRFRTAVKDPVDMIYILWSVFIGIICGCQLYEVVVLTSLVVTAVLIFFEHITFGKRPFVLIIHSKENEENLIDDILKKYTKKYRIKSRNYTSNGMDYAIELSVKNLSNLTDDLSKSEKIERFSIIEFDADDIV